MYVDRCAKPTIVVPFAVPIVENLLLVDGDAGRLIRTGRVGGASSIGHAGGVVIVVVLWRWCGASGHRGLQALVLAVELFDQTLHLAVLSSQHVRLLETVRRRLQLLLQGLDVLNTALSECPLCRAILFRSDCKRKKKLDRLQNKNKNR